MLKAGESETIADYQARFVFSPKSPSPNQAINAKLEFFNACVTVLKEVVKL